MQKETKIHVNRLRGFTLVELILVVGTIALVAGALLGLISNSYKDWKLGSNRSTLLQDGQAAIEQMTRIIRQAKGFISVSSSTDPAGQITFTDVYDVNQQFSRNALTNEIRYGQPGSLSALTGSVSNLVFTCYDVNSNILAGSVPASNIQSVGIETTLADGTNSFTLSGRVFCPKDFQTVVTVVINEIMYHPNVKGKDEKDKKDENDEKYEWVELYNFGDSAVDLAGWTICTGEIRDCDTLIADPEFGNGSTIIPANGYAVITAKNTKVTGVNPNAIRLSCDDKQIGNGLSDTGDTVAITNGSSTIDSVTYSSSWGGNGDGTSLSRINPNGPSNDQSNWTSGPQNGTPGGAN
jgi:type II secretory pathway pseudopilin PulG